jgi:hypothetical protein
MTDAQWMFLMAAVSGCITLWLFHMAGQSIQHMIDTYVEYPGVVVGFGPRDSTLTVKIRVADALTKAKVPKQVVDNLLSTDDRECWSLMRRLVQLEERDPRSRF